MTNQSSGIWKRLVGALGVVVALGGCTPEGGQTPAGHLTVYCAASVRPAIEPIAREYERGRGVGVSLQFGPSGGLEAQARLGGRGDVFVPAAADPYLERLAEAGLVTKSVAIATQRLVLAARPGEQPPESIAAMLQAETRFGVCNVQAAAGQHAEHALQSNGLWSRAASQATAMFPTVTELAAALRDGGRLEAAIVWDTTARQFGLPSRRVPELESATVEIAVGLFTGSNQQDLAADFVAYLADQGRQEFLKRGYEAPRLRNGEETLP